MKKYRKGKQIRSIEEFAQNDAPLFIVQYGAEKVTARAWLVSRQYRYLVYVIQQGRLYEAQAIEEGETA